MASSWGKSFGQAFGSAWGKTTAAASAPARAGRGYLSGLHFHQIRPQPDRPTVRRSRRDDILWLKP
jgi:hypothetical protein